jgi:hypothetical protein
MSGNDTRSTQRNISNKALGMALGLIFGGIIGLIIDNMIIFAGGGLVLGLAIGSALDNRRSVDEV